MRACLWIIKSIIGWWKAWVVGLNICEQGRHHSRHTSVYASHLQACDEHVHKCTISRWWSLAKLKNSVGNGHTSPDFKGRYRFAQNWYIQLYTIHKIFMFDNHLVVKVADFELVKPFESMNVNHCDSHLHKHLNTVLEGAWNIWIIKVTPGFGL